MQSFRPPFSVFEENFSISAYADNTVASIILQNEFFDAIDEIFRRLRRIVMVIG